MLFSEWPLIYMGGPSPSSYRRRYVCIASLQYGVPQGSVLGPILFTRHSPIGKIAGRHNLEIRVYTDSDHELHIFFKIKNYISQLQTL